MRSLHGGGGKVKVWGIIKISGCLMFHIQNKRVNLLVYQNFITFPKRFNIRPIGVVSNHFIGACKTVSNIGWCKFFDAIKFAFNNTNNVPNNIIALI